MLALQDSPAHAFLSELGKTLARPKAIVVISAHWETKDTPAVSSAAQPETIHDFGGFPRALYELLYPAPGAPELAAHIATIMTQAGWNMTSTELRGLDHGVWVPLRLMYPEADIPVTQISLLHNATPAEHFRLGSALSALRDEGVLVIGSGSMTHNLYEFRGQKIDEAAPGWVTEFTEWMHDKISARDMTALLDYRKLAPQAARNHPSEEHLLPLFVAVGASGNHEQAKRIHQSYEYGVLAMDIYSFE